MNSNNINLRSNVEMMTRFEGDVVNSLYDTFLISWHSKLSSKLPCQTQLSPVKREFIFAHDKEDTVIRDHFTPSSNSEDMMSALQRQLTTNQSQYTAQDRPATSISVNQRLNVQKHIEQTATVSETDSFHPYMFHPAHQPIPMALVNRQPHNLPG